jgi:pyruvate/2-oxoglutarate/acetoin dehydrogenase E1 component
MTGRLIRYSDAVRETLDLALERDPSVYVMGLGVPDPKGVFGTTLGLQERHGTERVLDMPTAENGMTGVAIGSAIVGMRPVMVHQRIDFALLAVEQIVNQAAKWHYMFGGRMRVPIVIRLIVGRGWGQGPQHSQSLQSWFAHVPGLKVVLPARPYDAKGLLAAAIEDDAPVIIIEHRWLHHVVGDVPEEWYTQRIGPVRVARPGHDATIAATSYMVLEALRAAEMLAPAGIDVEVLDVTSLRPLDTETIAASARKTGHFIAADTGWPAFGAAAELVAVVAENAFGSLASAPVRVGMADAPVPTSPALSQHSYPRSRDLVAAVARQLGLDFETLDLGDEPPSAPLDVPDASFAGPF